MPPSPAKPREPTLGGLLLAASVITAEQLATALRQQVIFGGRLGTNLMELGYAGHDDVATALAQLHEVPAALVRHLRGADRRARLMVPDRLCAELVALPLAFATAGTRRLVICVRDPDDETVLAALREVAHMDVVPAACPERTLYRLIGHFCGAPVPARMSAPAATEPSPTPASMSLVEIASHELATAPQIDRDRSQPMPTLSLVELDHEAARRDPTQVANKEPLSLSQLASRLREERAAAAEPEQAPVDIEAEPPPAPVTSPPKRERPPTNLSEALLQAASENRIEDALSKPVPVGPPPIDLEQALVQIIAATDRSKVTDAVIAYLKTRFDAGLILSVQTDVAYGVCGFGGHFDDSSVESILVPLTSVSPFRVAFRDAERYVGAGGGGRDSLFARFLHLFPLIRRPELCIVEPVVVRGEIISLIYAHTMGEEPLEDSALDDLDRLSAAVADAFHRFIRDQSRR